MPLTSELPPEKFTSSVYKEEGEISYPTEEKLNAFRDYIISCRQVKVTLEDEVGKVRQPCQPFD